MRVSKHKIELLKEWLELLIKSVKEWDSSDISNIDLEIVYKSGVLRYSAGDNGKFDSLIGVFLTEKLASYYGLNEEGLRYVKENLL